MGISLLFLSLAAGFLINGFLIDISNSIKPTVNNNIYHSIEKGINYTENSNVDMGDNCVFDEYILDGVGSIFIPQLNPGTITGEVDYDDFWLDRGDTCANKTDIIKIEKLTSDGITLGGVKGIYVGKRSN